MLKEKVTLGNICEYGDGCFDIYTVRLGPLYQLLQSSNDTRLEISSRSYAGEESGVSFKGGTSLSIMSGLSLGWQSIRLGANAELYQEQDRDLPVVVDFGDPDVLGEPLVMLTDRALLYIWRDSATDQWHMRWGDSLRRRTIEISIDSDTPITDLEGFGIEELWTYPVSYGDCEDYVLMKRHMLMQRGWPASSLLITVVLQPNGDGHAVLTVRTDRADYVLDNLNGKIKQWNKTEYRYLKRQSEKYSGHWTKIVDPRIEPSS